jgi:hypothetical protein
VPQKKIARINSSRRPGIDNSTAAFNSASGLLGRGTDVSTAIISFARLDAR